MRFKKFTALALAVVTAASVAMTGCGSRIDEDAVVATLGDKEISLGLANFMAQYTAVSYDSYITMGYAKENMWSQDLSGNGKTMQDNVKDPDTDSDQLSLGRPYERLWCGNNG